MRVTEPPKRPPPLGPKAEQQISVATIIAYSRFRREVSAYHHSLANYLRLMHWIDERRIEMQAEGRRYWVPTDGDFWQAIGTVGLIWSNPVNANAAKTKRKRDRVLGLVGALSDLRAADFGQAS
jgi:hypothetical protein